MRNISLKSIYARLSVTLLLLMGSMSTSAQYYLNVYEKTGSNNQYEIGNLDSVSIVKYDVANVLRLTINHSRLNLETGEHAQLSVRGFASNGTEIPLTGVIWKSDDTAVATVDSKGAVRTYKSGNTSITASIGSISVACSLTVIDHTYTLADLSRIIIIESSVNIESIASDIDSMAMVISERSVNIETGDSTKLVAIGYTSNGTEISLQNILWKSSNTTIATVDENGAVKTHNSGIATITASFGLISHSRKISVVDHTYTLSDVVKIDLDKKELDITTGDSDSLAVKGYASNGVEIPLTGVVWKSTNPSVASVDENGVVNALQQGNARISASAGSFSDTCYFKVNNKVADVGLYLGVMGFNDQLYTQPISILNTETKSLFDSFIDGMQMENATLLCYAVDNALDALHGIIVPENLTTVAVVTFTDGLDEGSPKKISYNPYKNRDEYLAGIKNRISTDSVSGIPVIAYSIGLRSPTIQDTSRFQSSLKQLASSDSYAMEVDSIDKVNAKFEQIAKSLNRSINYQTVPVVIPAPGVGERLRFTFDVTNDGANSQDAESSSLFIEGTFNVETNPLRYVLSDIEYHGMDSLSGPVIVGEEVDELHLKFTFEKVLTNDSTFLSKENIKEWHLTSNSSWQENDEFDKDQQPDIEIRSSSAIIMLVLDCSSSLKQNFPIVKANAQSFINKLYSAYGTPSGGGVNNGGNDSGNNNNNNSPYEYVDLGLSVKWATYNVGATKPEEYGDYYAWGETETKSSYFWTNYKFRTSGGSYSNVKFNKYNTSSSYGTVDNKTTLDAADDVAHIKWGGSWRMPTTFEQDELRDYCTWTWTTLNGVNGYRVTSNMSGYTDRSIFLPAAGYRSGTYLYSAGSNGNYWSSSLYTDDPRSAWNIYFYSSNVGASVYYRSSGFSVRPVCP